MGFRWEPDASIAGPAFLRCSQDRRYLWPAGVGHILAGMDTTGARPSDVPPSRLDVSLLGRFVVRVGGAELPVKQWPGVRAAHLVQLLALQPGGRLSRDEVIDSLWPELTPSAGAANLRKALHLARRALGRHDAVSIEAGELVLWPTGELAVDAAHFSQAASEALRQRAPAACALAADLYTGDLLPGSLYEGWTDEARQRLRLQWLDLLRASAQWECLARQDPTDEQAHRELMLLALNAGNRSQALRWYVHLREALRNELAAVPDSRTQALYERCASDPAWSGIPLLGRSDELAKAIGWLDLTPSRRPGGIVWRGEAGIGKTALCREVAVHARSRRWSTCRLDAADSARTYGLMTCLVESLLLQDRSRLERIGGPARSVLAQLTPMASPAAPLPGPLGRHQVVGAVRRLLLAGSTGEGLLLQIEDAHLLKDSDADVLFQLAVAGAPVCLMMTLRPPMSGSYLEAGLGRLERAGVVRVIDVGPLDADDMQGLLERAAPGTLGRAVHDRILGLAKGNPLVGIELARCALAGDRGDLPASAAEAIAEQMCDLPRDALESMRWLAICGQVIDVRTLESLATDVHIDVASAIDAALRAGVLVVSDSAYRFRHELVRLALLRHLPPHRRLQMHRRVAQALEARGASPADIADQWMAAGQPRAAMPWLLAAARDAMRLAAFSDARQHLAPVLERDPSHAEALRLNAEALDAQGDPAALFAYRLAASVADEAASHDLRAKAALAQVKLGDPKGALLALEGVQAVSVEGRLCEALAWSGAAALGAADPAIGTAKSAVARRLALESGDTTSLVIASWAQAAAAHARGELHRSVWADLQETSHAPHLAVRVFDGHLCITQRFLYGARPYAQVIDFAEAIAAEARRIGAARGLAFATTLRGEAEWLAGDLEQARLHLREGARLHRAIGGAVGEALSLQRLAEMALFEERRDEAEALLDEALDLARQTDIGFHLLDRIYGARISLHSNDPQAALHVMNDASASVRGPLESCPGCRITFAVPAAVAAARAGDLDLAHQHEAQCAYLANVVMRLPAWYAAHDEVRAHIEAASAPGGPDSARLFRSAAERFRAAGHPLDAERCERLARR